MSRAILPGGTGPGDSRGLAGVDRAAATLFSQERLNLASRIPNVHRTFVPGAGPSVNAWSGRGRIGRDDGSFGFGPVAVHAVRPPSTAMTWPVR